MSERRRGEVGTKTAASAGSSAEEHRASAGTGVRMPPADADLALLLHRRDGKLRFDPYDCEDRQDMFEWTSVHRSWCCMIKDVGCPRTSSAPYDCEAGLGAWERSWSASKKAWCCSHAGAGCQPLRSYFKPPQYTTTSTSAPYDCSVNYFTWEHGWSPGKRAWCCLHEGLRCPGLASDDRGGAAAAAVAKATSPYAGMLPAPASALEAGYDCKAEYYHWEEGWSEAKKVWCCQHEGLGCPDEVPYDCHDEPSDWQMVWTYKKKDWCCREEGLGCEHETVVFGKKFDARALRKMAMSRAPILVLSAGVLATVLGLWVTRSCSRSSTLQSLSGRNARNYMQLSFMEDEADIEEVVAAE